ncbi:hypothetical protein OR1_02631 [Geobacter sp. OR-1]|uniref:helix-turn-helix transcriptional regulator n=1 Tax=Geobacter sp. OR-1 TaxID=1266765 RepID=UPI000541993A|nr:WYL domain-containing protein [Geobacter sp. OR-1]GAM10342.1 hypothetical protein OR1_02631 [Geobacter sp. OR-1]
MGEQLYLERFIWFDDKVRQGKYPNATTLAEKFEVDKKTAQRSIEHFRDRIFAPLEYDPVKKGYYYYEKFEIPVARLSQNELLALLISKKLLSDASPGPLGEELNKVVDKLGTMIAAGMPGTISPDQAFSFRWNGFYPSDSIFFSIVSSALLQGRLLSFCYYSPTSSACTMRTVEPHHLVNYMGTWHLVAWCRLRNEWRDFLLSRMSLCQAEEIRFEFRPETEWRPHLDETFGIFQNKERFDVTLRFTPERAKWIVGEIWHPEQVVELQEDGYLVMTIPVSHHAEILMEILRHGAQVEILRPDWLRAKIVEEARALAELYSSSFEPTTR